MIEAQKGVYLSRLSSPIECVHSVFIPAFCIIAQGSKEIMLGDDRFRYDPWHYLLGSVELPVASQVIEASKERPFLGVRLTLEPALVTSVMLEAGISSLPSDASVKAMAVSRLDASLLDA